MIEKFGRILGVEYSFGYAENAKTIIQELKDMGVNTLEDLNNIIPENYAKVLAKHTSKSYEADNFASIIRDLLIINYKDKYFKHAWKNHWGSTDRFSIFLYEELGIKINKIPPHPHRPPYMRPRLPIPHNPPCACAPQNNLIYPLKAYLSK